MAGTTGASAAGIHNIGFCVGNDAPGVWIDGALVFAMPTVLGTDTRGGFGSVGVTGLTLLENLCYVKAFHRADVDEPAALPGQPVVHVTQFDGPRPCTVYDPVNVNGNWSPMKVAEYAADDNRVEIATGGSTEVLLGLENGPGLTTLVIAGAVDQLVYADGELINGGTLLPGVARMGISDGAASVAWFNRAGPLVEMNPGTFGGASGGDTGNTTRTAVYEAAPVPIAMSSQTGAGGTGGRSVASVDACTAQVTTHGGEQVDYPSAVATKSNPYAQNLTHLKAWLEGNAAHGPVLGTSAGTMASMREGILNWIHWLCLNWKAAGLTNEEMWALLDLLSAALDRWKSVEEIEDGHRPTGAQPDKRTMTPNEWAKWEEMEKGFIKEAEDLKTEAEKKKVYKGDIAGEFGKNVAANTWEFAKAAANTLTYAPQNAFKNGYMLVTDPKGWVDDKIETVTTAVEFGAAVIDDPLGVAEGVGEAVVDEVRGTVADVCSTDRERASKASGQLIVNVCETIISARIAADGAKRLLQRLKSACFVAGTMVLVLREDVDPAEVEAAQEKGLDLTPYCEPRPIEDIRPGDIVLSRPDGQPDAPLCFSRVRRTFVTQVGAITNLAVCDSRHEDTGTLTTTPGHAFWVTATNGQAAPMANPNADETDTGLAYYRDASGRVIEGHEGWVYAANLRTGYQLGSTTGSASVLRADLEEQATTVYNFAVEGTHTYFVLARTSAARKPSADKWLALWVHNHSKPSKLNAEIAKDRRLSREVVRADNADPNRPGSKDHLHFKDGTVQNHDGTLSHQSNGTPSPSKYVREWLRSHGWVPYGEN